MQGEGETEDCAHSKKTHLEEDELNEMIHSCNLPHLGGNNSQKQQESWRTCRVKECENRSGAYVNLSLRAYKNSLNGEST